VSAGPYGAYPAADAREVFQGDSRAGAFSGSDDGLGDEVVLVGGVPLFLCGPASSGALGSLGALGPATCGAGRVAVYDGDSGHDRPPVAGTGGGDVGDFLDQHR